MTKGSRRGLAAVLAVLAVLAGAGLWWFLRDDSPPEVNLDTAAKGVTTTTAGTGGRSSTTPGSVTPATIDGTWKVDTTTGTFDYEAATGTFVGFRIQENLANVGAATAVGRTNAVTGTMAISGTSVTAADITVDMTKITTNQSRRDQRVQDALATDQFPTARFELTAPIDLGPDATSGQSVTVTAKGDLTVHGVTKAVQFPLQAKLVGDTVVVVGSIDVTFADFGVKVPTAPVVLSVDDHGKLELQLLFKRA
ncbi:MAG: YceI family protein [Actinobacteria bacterium]|nr:YceI family protein [Actinomycetota bacterium]